MFIAHFTYEHYLRILQEFHSTRAINYRVPRPLAYGVKTQLKFPGTKQERGIGKGKDAEGVGNRFLVFNCL